MSVELSEVLERYVAELKAAGWIRSARVEQAFRRAPRHRLIDEIYSGPLGLPRVTRLDPTNPEHLALVYADRALVTHWPELSTSSQPGLMALMLEQLALEPGMRVLEIGAGTGYNAALLAELVGARGQVTTLDIQEALAHATRQRLAAAGYGAIHVLARDGLLGAAEQAPFQRIVASVGCADLSPHWLAQLAPDGGMLIPLAHGGIASCPVLWLQQQAGVLLGRVVAYANYMPVRGASAADLWPLDRQAVQLGRRARQVGPDVVYPLWEGLHSFPDPTPRPSPEWAARLEFLYFLALHTRQTFLSYEGIGYGDSNSFVLIGEDAIGLYGRQAPALYDELERIYQRWESIGRPRMLDYQSHFVPRSASGAAPLSDSRTWTIERVFFRQIVRV